MIISGITSLRANISHKGLKEDVKNKINKELTPQNVLIGLSALSTIVIGGLLLKKHLSSKSVEQEVKNFTDEFPIKIEKPEIFSREYLDKIIDKWSEAGKITEYSAVICVGKKALKNIFNNNEYISKNLSENGFGIFIQHPYNPINLDEIKILDPVVNTDLKFLNTIKNDNFYTVTF